MGTTGYEPQPVGTGCDCICHNVKDGVPAAIHIVACCQPCGTCGKLVTNRWREAHEKDCAARQGTP